ncbi:hypothetical protein IMSAGC021_01545 [Muribaculaceae bacterium]|nr:hypothetical protein IMSAGC021_01545 [Muribaculaceae bacterium]
MPNPNHWHPVLIYLYTQNKWNTNQQLLNLSVPRFDVSFYIESKLTLKVGLLRKHTLCL